MAPPNAPDTVPLNDLVDSIGRLAGQLQVIGDSLEAIREDLNWLTRNPLPFELQPSETRYVISRESFGETLMESPVPQDPSQPLGTAAEWLARNLQQTLASVSKDQLPVVIDTLDQAHSHLLTLLRGEVRNALHTRLTEATTVPEAGTQRQPEKPTRSPDITPGRLF
ncbi:MAG: hypothetical protein HQ518_32385 [Rhodopirellula sp.]|nr:hypothetical protein [Rhodopirellula sp.]